MKSKITMLVAALSVGLPIAASAPANAQSYYNHGRAPHYQSWDDGRTYYGRDRAYRGRNVNYYRNCRRSSGTTGAIAGGAGGALIGSALGHDTLSTVLGAIGGGLLGRSLDKRHDAEQNYRNGC